MWFVLGFICGILFSVAAILALAWYLDNRDRKQQAAKLVLNERGEIVRADDA